VRPTTDRVRQALFNVVASNYIQDWRKLVVLDLFAGTGALGLEALSRGAKACTFVEQDRRVIPVLKKNLLLAHTTTSVTKLVRADVYDFLQQKRRLPENEQAGLVLADPPYGKGHLIRLLDALTHACDSLSPKVLIVIEGEKREQVPEKYSDFRLLKSKSYGNSSLFFLKRNKDR